MPLVKELKIAIIGIGLWFLFPEITSSKDYTPANYWSAIREVFGGDCGYRF
jgi:hypothetical protein